MLINFSSYNFPKKNDGDIEQKQFFSSLKMADDTLVEFGRYYYLYLYYYSSYYTTSLW